MKGRLTILLLVPILTFVYWHLWLPGPRVAIDFPIVPNEQLINQLDLPRIWALKDVEGMGEYSVFTLWSYPFTLASGFLAKLGLGFDIQERILWIIPFLIIGTVGIWKIGRELNLSNYAKCIAALFYLTNTYILLVLDGGQLSIALGYAFLPLSFLAIKNATDKDLKAKILAGLSVWILGVFDIRIIYILILLCLIYFLNFHKGISGWIKTSLICGSVWVGLNAYWLLPLIADPISSSTYQKLTQTHFQSLINLGHGFLMLAPHWYKNVFGNITQLKLEFFIIPILVFLAPILRHKDRQVGFWILVALIGIFLTKGMSEPFPNIYKWLFINIPGFSLFRDSSKFFFLVALSYAVLLGITFDEIIKRIKTLKIGFIKIRFIFLLFTISYLLLLIRPVWLGEMTGTFSKPRYEKEYEQLNKYFENDKQFSRIFWLPSKYPLGYFSQNHPSVEGLRLVSERPFGIGTKGTYEILNFLREAPYMGEIFDVAGIGYIVYPYLDLRRDNIHPDNIEYYDTFSKQLSNLPWLTNLESSPIPAWRTKQHQDKFFIVPNIWWVLGSDNIYNEATKSAKLKLSKNALIFADEQSELGRRIDEVPKAKIILNRKTLIDLAASFIEPSELIFPARQLNVDPNYSGWWKQDSSDLIRWRDFLQTKYGIDNLDFDLGGGWAVGEGNLRLKVKSEKLKAENILLARVLESTRSGELKFYQDNQLIGNITTRREGNNVRWFEVGKLTNEKELEIESLGDINVVNALAILKEEEWNNLKIEADGYKLKKRITNYGEGVVNNTKATVTYQAISPTKYSIKVDSLEQPSFLVFSEKYDPNWQMEGQASLPVYSILNGFKIEKNGTHEIVFKPQEKVEQGLIISILTLLLGLGLLINKKVIKSSMNS